MPETVTMADTPQQQESQPQTAPKPAPRKEEARPRKSLVRRLGEHPIKVVVFLVILIGAAIGGIRLWNYLDSYESTDDAEIDGDIYAITSRIAGTIKAVHVQDNQEVKAGQLLVELDPADYDVAVAQARAALNESRSLVAVARPNVPLTSVTTQTALSTSATDIAQARAAVAGAQRDYESAVADIRKAEADSAKAQADLARYKQLIAKDEISKQQYDQAEAAAKSAGANVDAKRATSEASARAIEEAQARLEEAQTKQTEVQTTRPQQIAIQNATVQSRQASAVRQQTLVDQAVLSLSYTKIFAPVDGIIGKKNAEPGQQVAAGQQLMADVPVNDIWVTANFKETQLKKMRPNQRVTIHVDSYDRDYEGFVESVAGATGARFSLLPPENATGNYVKVVQRVPVRIRFKAGQDTNHELRPGMSVDPKVWLQ
ncbi:MAG TPA: HlyD family secretion protein [Bryobacteraceae bacterium]|jgi:membrane fusion protein (multidrug efflux system)|nr:HlyD family secretion protein [Bryobacteraceae bacterium]